MNKRPLIEGGYVFFARIFMEQPFFHISNDCFKLAMYLLADARRKKDPFIAPKGDIINHGETCISLRIVAEDCSWYENRMKRKWSQQKVARMLDELQDVGFLKHNSDRHGTLVSICNYAFYQNADNYKVNNSDRDGTDMEQGWNTHGTAMETNKKGNTGETGNNGETNTPPNPLEGGTGCDDPKDESFHLDAQPQPKAKRERKPAQRNPIMDALATHAEGVTDLSQVTPSAWKQIAKAASDIKAVCPDVTPDEIRRRVIAYFTAMPNATCTSTAIAKHWARCDGSRKPGAKPEETERERLERLARQQAEDLSDLNVAN